MKKERWTFASDSCGYTLFLDGERMDGVGTMGTGTHTADGRIRHWRHRAADLKMYYEQAQRECERRNEKLFTDELANEWFLIAHSPNSLNTVYLFLNSSN